MHFHPKWDDAMRPASGRDARFTRFGARFTSPAPRDGGVDAERLASIRARVLNGFYHTPQAMTALAHIMAASDAVHGTPTG
jgi:hypothetical protein